MLVHVKNKMEGYNSGNVIRKLTINYYRTVEKRFYSGGNEERSRLSVIDPHTTTLVPDPTERFWFYTGKILLSSF